MRKIIKRVSVCLLIAVFLGSIQLMHDRIQLRKGLIRFHVVANSDSSTDQSAKLQVRDAVLESLRRDLQNITSVTEAKEYLQQNIPKIESVAKYTLEQLGMDNRVAVTLCREVFDIRHYDTFTLPSGVYDSLRIVIGDGNGKNWWCVSFPALCIPATAEGFSAAAAGAGFSEPLVDTITGKNPMQVRFFLLDQLGRLENIFFQE